MSNKEKENCTVSYEPEEDSSLDTCPDCGHEWDTNHVVFEEVCEVENDNSK